MKFLICAAVLVAGAMARPGGYTGYGGVYQQMNVDAQTMEGAKGAAKMAVDIFNDESLTGAVEQRNVRKATYVPTFFTAQEQPVVHPLAASATNRFQRNAQTYEGQIFYDEYRPKSYAVYRR